MTHLDEALLRRTFRAELFELSLMPDPDRYFSPEGQKFEPPSDAPGRGVLWVRESLRTLNESLNASGTLQAIGHLIYGVYRFEGNQLEQGEALAKAIVERFASGTSVPHTTQTASIDHSERGHWRPDTEHTGWVFKPVTITWRVHTSVLI